MSGTEFYLNKGHRKVTFRYGITVPFDAPLIEQKELYQEFADLGYTDLWSSEADGTDGFTPLILGSPSGPYDASGVAIIPAYTRGLRQWRSTLHQRVKLHQAGLLWELARLRMSLLNLGTASRSKSPYADTRHGPIPAQGANRRKGDRKV